MSRDDQRLDPMPLTPPEVLRRELALDRRLPRPLSDFNATQPGVVNPLTGTPAVVARASRLAIEPTEPVRTEPRGTLGHPPTHLETPARQPTADPALAAARPRVTAAPVTAPHVDSHEPTVVVATGDATASVEQPADRASFGHDATVIRPSPGSSPIGLSPQGPTDGEVPEAPGWAAATSIAKAPTAPGAAPRVGTAGLPAWAATTAIVPGPLAGAGAGPDAPAPASTAPASNLGPSVMGSPSPKSSSSTPASNLGPSVMGGASPTPSSFASSSNPGPSAMGGSSPTPSSAAPASNLGRSVMGASPTPSSAAPASNLGPSLMGGAMPKPSSAAPASNLGPSLMGASPPPSSFAPASNLGPSVMGGASPTPSSFASASNPGPSLMGGASPKSSSSTPSSNVGPSLMGGASPKSSSSTLPSDPGASVMGGASPSSFASGSNLGPSTMGGVSPKVAPGAPAWAATTALGLGPASSSSSPNPEGPTGADFSQARTSLAVPAVKRGPVQTEAAAPQPAARPQTPAPGLPSHPMTPAVARRTLTEERPRSTAAASPGAMPDVPVRRDTPPPPATPPAPGPRDGLLPTYPAAAPAPVAGRRVALGAQFAVTQPGIAGPFAKVAPLTPPVEADAAAAGQPDFVPAGSDLGHTIDSEDRKVPTGVRESPLAAAAHLAGEAAGAEEVESVEVIARPAPLWRRVGATLVDLVMFAVVLSGASAAVLAVKEPKLRATGGVAKLLPLVLDALMTRAVPLAATAGGLLFVWVLLFSWRFNARTPGRKVFGLHLVDGHGHSPSLLRALVRSVFAMPSLAVGLAGYWLSLFDRRGQSLHDKLSGTFVVRLTTEDS